MSSKPGGKSREISDLLGLKSKIRSSWRGRSFSSLVPSGITPMQ
ncbi:MAG: hypothetical protein ACD_77C00307G0002, partial [uncultured bacterium]